MSKLYSSTNLFKDKKITLMGLGLLGRGIGDARFLAKMGAKLTVTDLKKPEELVSSLALLKKYKNIRYVLGEHRLEDFRECDMVIKAAGVPLDSPYIAEAKKHGIPVEMSTALFARLSPATIIGVTGTRGKSTTSHLIYHVLKQAFARPFFKSFWGKKHNVYLGGNVKGMSTLELLPNVKKDDVVVLELDSWQLQGFGEDKISPHIAVFTTFMPDHLNYYKGSLEQYFSDKANIFLYQKPDEILVAGTQVAPMITTCPSKKVISSDNVLPSDWTLKIPGKHNRYNAGLAFSVLESMGIPKDVIKKGIESFGGVPGRLEFVKKTKNGVGVYNDTTATTPDALAAALKALGKRPANIVLIMGGADKNIPLDSLWEALDSFVSKIILLPGSGTDRFIADNHFQTLKEKIEVLTASSMQEAVSFAARVLENNSRNDTVLLLSPGFASFGLFKNEFDRGDTFLKEIKKLV